MKKLLTILFLWPFVLFGANPPYEAFLGTNGITVISNPPSGKILINGAVLATTNYVNEAATNRIFLAATNGAVVHSNFVGNTVTYTIGATNPPDVGFAALEVQTNGVRVGLVTNINWTAGVTGSVSGSTATLGVSSAGGGLSGTTNFIQLSVQAVKWAATNYSYTDPGWQVWETVYTETNELGTRANLEGSWQFLVPPDYATNSLNVLLNYSIINTNGPNTSNVIWGASVLVGRSGTTNNVRTNAFGSLVFGTNDWIAKYDGTNYVTNLVINLSTSSLLMAGDLAVLKLVRDAMNDTYGGAVALHGLQLQYTRP